MISGPNGIYICDECISVCADAMMRDLGLHRAAGRRPLRRYVPGHALAGNRPPCPPRGGQACRRARDGRARPGDRAGKPAYPARAVREPFRARGGPGRGQARPFGGRVQPLQAHQPGRGCRRRATWSWPRATSCCSAPPAPARRFWPRRSRARCSVPFAIADATTLTEAGYVGEDVENILSKLITAADFDVPRAEIGIIYIDEIDKIARKAENLSITRDVSGEGVQQALLKIVEGCEASVPPQGGRKHPQQELIHIDTTNILFILGGAFVGPGRHRGPARGQERAGLRRRAAGKQEAGRSRASGAGASGRPEQVRHDPRVRGPHPGRHGAFTSCPRTTWCASSPSRRTPWSSNTRRCSTSKTRSWCSSRRRLRAIAHEAVEHGTGARGLRSICERVLHGRDVRPARTRGRVHGDRAGERHNGGDQAGDSGGGAHGRREAERAGAIADAVERGYAGGRIAKGRRPPFGSRDETTKEHDHG